MTLPRLYSLNKYWGAWPPIHKLIAIYLGVKPPKETKPQDEEHSFDEFMMMSSQLFNAELPS